MCHKIDNFNFDSAYFLDFFGITFDLLKEVSPQPSADEGAVAGLCASRCIVLKPHKGQLHSPWIHPATHKTQQCGAFYSHLVQSLSSLSVRKGVFRCDISNFPEPITRMFVMKIGSHPHWKKHHKSSKLPWHHNIKLSSWSLSPCISVILSFVS